MLTVNHVSSAVEFDLAAGRLRCPGCSGVLAPWGWARVRSIRHRLSSAAEVVRVRPRRGRCAGCAVTHVLLGAEFAARRADAAAVIAAGIEAKVLEGAGYRKIAARLGRPVSTVRGWLRAFTASALTVAEEFTALAHRDGPDAAGLWPAPVAMLAGQAVAVLAAYAAVLAARFAVATVTWHTAALAAAGPWFFSRCRWQGKAQHELALMPEAFTGEGGQ